MSKRILVFLLFLMSFFAFAEESEEEIVQPKSLGEYSPKLSDGDTFIPSSMKVETEIFKLFYWIL